MTDTLKFVTVDVFTNTPYEGNPLAIVLVPPKLDISDEKLQAIAREFNLSETVFLYLNEDDGQAYNIPEWRIRIFMTDIELPFAGHPTIGTAVYALAQLNSTSATKARLHCPAGVIEVDFNLGTRVAKASIPHDVHLHIENKHTAEDVYEMQPGIKGKAQPDDIQVFSPVKGMSFLIVKLPSLEALAEIKPASAKPALKRDVNWDSGFNATLFFVETGPDQVRTRMIAGQLEDPATGAASCALGAMLALRQKESEVSTTRITQGVEMGRNSEIGVTTTLSSDGEKVVRIELFGTAVQVLEGSIRI